MDCKRSTFNVQRSTFNVQVPKAGISLLDAHAKRDYSQPVKATLNEITKAALALPADEKEALAEKIVRSLAVETPPDIKRKQLAEVMRRREEVLSGKVKGISGKQALREVQELLK
jgi:putative addiction module component (TIGR02574 family)